MRPRPVIVRKVSTPLFFWIGATLCLCEHQDHAYTEDGSSPKPKGLATSIFSSGWADANQAVQKIDALRATGSDAHDGHVWWSRRGMGAGAKACPVAHAAAVARTSVRVMGSASPSQAAEWLMSVFSPTHTVGASPVAASRTAAASAVT